MGRSALLGVLIAGLAVGGWFLYRVLEDDRIDRAAARLGMLLDTDLEEYQSAMRISAPVPGKLENGDAADWYRKAFAAFRSSGIDKDRLWLLGRGDDGVPELLSELRPVLELVSNGARTVRASVIESPGDDEAGEDIEALEARIGELLALDAGERPEQLLVAFRFGGDMAQGKPFEAPYRPARELAVEALVNRVSRQQAGDRELEDLVLFLGNELRVRPEPWEAFQAEVLGRQVRLRDALAGAVPLREVAGEFGIPATRGHLLDTWIELREWAERRSPDNPPGYVHAGSITLDSLERHRLKLAALLMGAQMLREKRRTGIFPRDLESVRPEVVTANPAGGRWSLEPDPKTGLPAIHVRDGRPLRVVTEAEKGLPDPPLFEFQ